MYYKKEHCKKLEGVWLKSISFIEESEDESQRVVFNTKGGNVFQISHIRDCCESVVLSSIKGNLSNLLNEKIISCTYYREYSICEEDFQFYKLETRKGIVEFVWHGDGSDCNSSTDVDFSQIINEEAY